MQNALHLKAIVNPGGKIELVDPQLPSVTFLLLAKNVMQKSPETRVNRRFDGS